MSPGSAQSAPCSAVARTLGWLTSVATMVVLGFIANRWPDKIGSVAGGMVGVSCFLFVSNELISMFRLLLCPQLVSTSPVGSAPQPALRGVGTRLSPNPQLPVQRGTNWGRELKRGKSLEECRNNCSAREMDGEQADMDRSPLRCSTTAGRLCPSPTRIWASR